MRDINKYNLLFPGDRAILAHFSKGRRVVEIGTFFGDSARLMGEYAKTVVSIDNYSNSASPEYQEIISFPEHRNLHNVLFVNGDRTYSSNFLDNSIDLLFIDAGHTYHDVLGDFYAFKNKIVRSGVVLFHDYSELFLPVVKAVDEIKETLDLIEVDLSVASDKSTVIKGFYL